MAAPVAAIPAGLSSSPSDRDGRHEACHECVREDALSVRWKSAPWDVTAHEAEGNCVAVRRGGEQPEAKEQPVG